MATISYEDLGAVQHSAEGLSDPETSYEDLGAVQSPDSVTPPPTTSGFQIIFRNRDYA